MKEEQEDKIFEYLARMLTILVLGLIVAVLISMCSCTRTVYVPVKTEVKDSLVLHFRDSVNIINKINIKDSINIRDSIVVTVDENGKVTGKETWHNSDHYHSVNDSTAYYKAQVDSLINVKNKTEEVIVEVEKPLSSMQKMWMNLGKFSAGIGFCAIFLVLVYIVSIRKRIGTF